MYMPVCILQINTENCNLLCVAHVVLVSLFIQLSGQITSMHREHCELSVAFFLFQIKIELLNTFIIANYPYFGFTMSRGHRQVN